MRPNLKNGSLENYIYKNHQATIIQNIVSQKIAAKRGYLLGSCGYISFASSVYIIQEGISMLLQLLLLFAQSW